MRGWCEKLSRRVAPTSQLRARGAASSWWAASAKGTQHNVTATSLAGPWIHLTLPMATATLARFLGPAHVGFGDGSWRTGGDPRLPAGAPRPLRHPSRPGWASRHGCPQGQGAAESSQHVRRPLENVLPRDRDDQPAQRSQVRQPTPIAHELALLPMVAKAVALEGHLGRGPGEVEVGLEAAADHLVLAHRWWKVALAEQARQLHLEAAVEGGALSRVEDRPHRGHALAAGELLEPPRQPAAPGESTVERVLDQSLEILVAQPRCDRFRIDANV